MNSNQLVLGSGDTKLTVINIVGDALKQIGLREVFIPTCFPFFYKKERYNEVWGVELTFDKK